MHRMCGGARYISITGPKYVGGHNSVRHVAGMTSQYLSPLVVILCCNKNPMQFQVLQFPAQGRSAAVTE